MKMINAYIAYIKDNPQHYWFRRKLYGWGWTPATREGWLSTLAFLFFILAIAIRAENQALSETMIFWQVVVPISAATILFLLLCYKTGEPPRWQWRIPQKYWGE